tara:strand:- start:599 stop:784 length:186 start_codon:yes stop_codon:yes gene_type:complete
MKKQTLSDKYGWYAILYNLAGENLLNISKVAKIPIYQTLTFLCYEMDNNYEKNQQLKKSIK